MSNLSKRRKTPQPIENKTNTRRLPRRPNSTPKNKSKKKQKGADYQDVLILHLKRNQPSLNQVIIWNFVGQ